MMNWFYVKHRYLAFKRDKSSGNNWLVGTILTLFGIQVVSGIYAGFPEIVENLTVFRPDLKESEAHHLIFLVSFLFGGTLMLLFSPPKLHFQAYSVWKTERREITAGYLLLALLSPVMLGWTVLMLPVLVRCSAYVDLIILRYIILMLGVQFFTIAIHFSQSKFPLRLIAIIVFYVVSAALILNGIPNLSMAAWFPILIFISAVVLAGWRIHRYQLSVGEDTETRRSRSILDFFRFKEGWMQLEWALMTRNKRTRSNLIAGFVSIPFIFYLFTNTTEDVSFTPVILIGTVVTAFVMLQHGIYTIGWEGSYFDLLISRTSLHSFFTFKFKFFVISSAIMFIASSFSLFWNPTLFFPLIATFFYNIGINSFIILQGSLRNTTKLSLDQGTVFNTQAINGTLMVNSILIILVPLILYALGERLFGELYACLFLLGLGALGLIFHRNILSRITKEAEDKKYSLAKGFRS